MCPHTTICVLIQLYMCPHTTTFLSSYYCIGVRHTTINVPSYYYICPHPTIYVSSYYYLCVLVLAHSPLLKTLSRMLLSGLSAILLYMCPHTTASSYYCICARIPLPVFAYYYVPSYCCIFVLILMYVSSYCYICVCIPLCVLILLYMCPHPNYCMCPHTNYCICVLILLHCGCMRP
jgi:hypothetical protein